MFEVRVEANNLGASYAFGLPSCRESKCVLDEFTTSFWWLAAPLPAAVACARPVLDWAGLRFPLSDTARFLGVLLSGSLSDAILIPSTVNIPIEAAAIFGVHCT